MARTPRVEFSGAVYHVMCRGDRKKAIFHDDQDRERFLATLVEARERTGWLIHAYVLMSNHYHFLLETPEANLVAGMQWLQGTYTVRFNRRHGFRGHLFQGRYKALPVAPEEHGYFLQLSSYIHLNPVRARLVTPTMPSLAEYAWSSYPAYLSSPSRRDPWVEVSRVLGDLGLADTAAGRRRYRAYMERRRAECGERAGRQELEAEWREIRRGWYLGSDSFREQVQGLVGKVVEGRSRSSYSGPSRVAHDEARAAELVHLGLKKLLLASSDLSTMRKSAAAKQVLAWWVRRQTVVSNRWLAENLRMGHAGNMSKMVSRVETQPTLEMKRMKNQIAKP